MELTGYLAVARRWWWTLLVATWVAAMAGLLVASRIPPTYEAQAQLLVGPINTDADTLKASQALVQTYAQLALSADSLKSTAQEVPGLDPVKLAASVRTTASDVTRVLTIRAQDADPNRAALIANTIADELIQLTTGATTRPEGQLEKISPAVAPTAPIAPQVSLIVLLAMVAGLIGGLVLVILVEYATDMVRDAGDLGRLARSDVLATIAFDQRTPGADPLPVAAATAPGAVNAIAFRLLASKIAVGEGDAMTRTILVTAVGPGDSAVGATGLAAAVAASGRRVVVVDGAADSDITQTLRLDGRPGLREAGSSGRDDGLTPVMGPVGIHVLPSGVEGSVELLPVERTRAIIGRLLQDHDLVIVDGGAVQRSPGALTWARVADHTIVLVRRGLSRRDDLRLALESLRYVDAKISGTVLVQRTTGRGLRSGRSRAAEPRRSSQPAAAPHANANVTTPQGSAMSIPPVAAPPASFAEPSTHATETLARRLDGGMTVGSGAGADLGALGIRSASAAWPAAAAAEPAADPRLRQPEAPWRVVETGIDEPREAPTPIRSMRPVAGGASAASPAEPASATGSRSRRSASSAQPPDPAAAPAKSARASRATEPTPITSAPTATGPRATRNRPTTRELAAEDTPETQPRVAKAATRARSTEA